MKGSVGAELLRREGKLNLLPLIGTQRREKRRRSVDHGAGLAIRRRGPDHLRVDPRKAYINRERNGTGQNKQISHSSPMHPATSIRDRIVNTPQRILTIPLGMSFTLRRLGLG
jgi:hypothetical protein